MKLFKSAIWALMAVTAVAFTACEDDDDYVAGLPSAGAYFASDLPNQIEVTPPSSPSFSVPVNRTEGGASSANIAWTVTPASAAFTFPSTVNFDGASTVTNAMINVDESQLVPDQLYTITAKIDDPNNYANGIYSFTYFYGSKMISEKTSGKYIYTVYFNGYQDNIPVEINYRENNPNKVTYTLYDWFEDGIVMTLNIPDMSATGPNGGIPVTVTPTNTYYENSNYPGQPIWVTDLYTYYTEVSPTPANVPDIDDSYYDPETKTFYFDMVWYIPGLGVFGADIENFILAGGSGPADYTVTAEYVGLFTDPAQNSSAIGKISCGPDVAGVKAACVATSDPQTAINYILLGNEGVQDVEPGEGVTAMFPVSESGSYILMAISYSADGTPQAFGYDEATINFGANPNEGWTSLGYLDYYDPWVIPAYTMGGAPIANTDFPIGVEVLENDETPGLYRLMDPYHQDSFLLTELNTGKSANWCIQVYDDGFVSVPQQYSGYATDKWGNLSIGNYDGYLLENNPDVPHSAIQAFLEQNGEVPSYVEDGVITITTALFGCPGLTNDEFGYTWNNPQEGYLVLPSASNAAARKARAASVAAPKFRGIAREAMNYMGSKKNGLRESGRLFVSTKELQAKGATVR